jgi:hypothetical protein
MTACRTWIVLLASMLVSLPVRTASAISSSDFLCKGLGGTEQGQVYNAEVGGCAKGKSSKSVSVCHQNILCAYVAPDLQHFIENNYASAGHDRVTFGKIPVQDRIRLFELTTSKDTLAKYPELAAMVPSWRPGVATCEGFMKDGRPMCKSPDSCKEDRMFDSRPAQIDYADENDRLYPKLFDPADKSPSGKGAGRAQP